jgi:hypothetical protein
MNKKIVIPSMKGKAISILDLLAKRKAEFNAKVEALIPFNTKKSSVNSAAEKKECN